ncbi:uncharacterized protein LOC131266942 [Anopheles coustani]|uniref:uncharacterized protein LOC131266942 n=1 Tax=Anopheles coustani TaxID=139045 RepID=UPI00265B3D21|nr:uncharacterized protein LOC131266942 [Anopheles coustani]
MESVSLSSKCNIFFLVIERTGLREIEFEENDVLRELTITSSRLKNVPQTLHSLDICGWKTPSLSSLDMSSNFLTSVPQCMENLKNLKTLSLDSNRIM